MYVPAWKILLALFGTTIVVCLIAQVVDWCVDWIKSKLRRKDNENKD